MLPSLSEGFGLPALEALAVGRPVLGSRDSVTADLCGDLAVLVDPYDPGSIARGMLQLLEDDGPARRAHAGGPGLARAFRPEQSARRWWELLGELPLEGNER